MCGLCFDVDIGNLYQIGGVDELWIRIKVRRQLVDNWFVLVDG